MKDNSWVILYIENESKWTDHFICSIYFFLGIAAVFLIFTPVAHQLSSPTDYPAVAPHPRPLSVCEKTDFVFHFARFIAICCQAAVWRSSCLHKRLIDPSLTHSQLAVYSKHIPQFQSHHIAYTSSSQLDDWGDFIGLCWCEAHFSAS